MGLPSDIDLLGWLKGEGKIDFIPMTNNCEFDTNPISECQIVRGLNDKVIRSGVNVHPSHKFNSVAQLYEQYLQEKNYLSRTRHIASIKDPVKTGRTFPHIFKRYVDCNGFIDTANISTAVSSTPSLAGLHQGAGVGNMLQNILTAGSKLNVSRLPNLLEDGIDFESWSDQIEDLRSLIGRYGIASDLESDSDD